MHETKTLKNTCPICAGINKPVNYDHTLIKPNDIIFSTNSVVALINSFFIEGSEGHVIIVPTQHYKNLYELPDDVGYDIFQHSKRLAVAMRQAYPGCKGITIQQNNERSGGQHISHYHMHIIPRYEGDQFGIKVQSGARNPAPEAERSKYSLLLRKTLGLN